MFRLLLGVFILLSIVNFTYADAMLCCKCNDGTVPEPALSNFPSIVCSDLCKDNGGYSGSTYVLRELAKCGAPCSNVESSCYQPGQKLCDVRTPDVESRCVSLGVFGEFQCVASGLYECREGEECDCDNWGDDNRALDRKDCSCGQVGCCSYGNTNTFSDCRGLMSLDECRKGAKELGVREYRWGEGTCGSSSNNKCEGNNVKEYLKVTLTEFVAKNLGKSVLLKWVTSDEIDSVAFHILRGTPKDKVCTHNLMDYVEIKRLKDSSNPNRPLTIWALGGLGVGMRHYSYVDKSVKPDVTYCYMLEDVDSAYNSIYYLDFITLVTVK